MDIGAMVAADKSLSLYHMGRVTIISGKTYL